MKMRNLLVRSMANPLALGGLVLATSVLGPISHANAALTVTLSETGYAPLTFTDTGNTGAVTYFGPYGDFTTNFIVGQSNKLNGPLPVGTLQIQSLDVTKTTNSGTKTLMVVLTDDGYTFPGTTGTTDALDSSVGGTLTSDKVGDSVTFQSEVLSPLTTGGLQTFVAPASVLGTTSFSSTAPTAYFVQGSSYSLENITNISLSGAGEQANVAGTTTTTVAVPEPTSAIALGLAGISLLRRRRNGP